MENEKSNAAALLPIGVFLVIFLGSGVITGDFYAMPAIVAFQMCIRDSSAWKQFLLMEGSSSS